MFKAKQLLSVILLFFIVFPFDLSAQEELSEHLKIFEPFIGKTWKGKFVDKATGKEAVDISCWERALNGKAVRNLHSLNNGEYGGETIIVWDNKEKELVFYYFTTAEYFTHGTMKFENGKFISTEAVEGNANGITKVKAVAEVLDDGRLKSSSSYLKNGEWVPGHEIVYEEAPDAEVIFK